MLTGTGREKADTSNPGEEEGDNPESWRFESVLVLQADEQTNTSLSGREAIEIATLVSLAIETPTSPIFDISHSSNHPSEF